MSNDENNSITSQKKPIKEPTSNTSKESSTSNLEDKIVVATPSEIEYKSYEVKPSEEESISAKAKDAGQSLRDLAISLGQKAKAITEEKTTGLKAQAAKPLISI